MRGSEDLSRHLNILSLNSGAIVQNIDAGCDFRMSSNILLPKPSVGLVMIVAFLDNVARMSSNLPEGIRTMMGERAD